MITILSSVKMTLRTIDTRQEEIANRTCKHSPIFFMGLQHVIRRDPKGKRLLKDVRFAIGMAIGLAILVIVFASYYEYIPSNWVNYY